MRGKMTAIAVKPLGVILTKMRWNRPLWYPFNIGLLGYQLVMLAAGKLIGVIDTTWRQIWSAAFCCHVRVLLNPYQGDVWRALSITAPEAKIDYWTQGSIVKSRGHFIYLDPTFDVTATIQFRGEIFAWDLLHTPLVRRYDYAQLFSYLINLIIWLCYWPTWGREIIKASNLKGGRETCSSGGAALVRWAAGAAVVEFFLIARLKAAFVNAMVSPCLYLISDEWRKIC